MYSKKALDFLLPLVLNVQVLVSLLCSLSRIKYLFCKNLEISLQIIQFKLDFTIPFIITESHNVYFYHCLV